MRNLIKKAYKDTDLIYVLKYAKYLYDIIRFKSISDEKFIKKKYAVRVGKELNLVNPINMSEKIQWLKLYDKRDIHTLCADKYKVREYIKEKIGSEYLIPLIYQTKKIKDITPENLPDYPCVIKTNHDSGGVFIIKNKYEADFKKIKRSLFDRMNTNYFYGNREWQYKNIERRIIVEKLLLDEHGNIPNDVKIHCFNGKAEFFQIDSDRFGDHKRIIYNKKWKIMDFQWGPLVNGKIKYEKCDPLPKPNNLNLIIELSEKLAIDFPYVRIDFYNVNNKLYFGEITFHHGSGYELMDPPEWNEKLGNLIKL